ncbi:f-box/fbd/lrr-repeat protein [Quercus suber]|uniref:F-box/fbd/lrr-repeat protein n=1 Tax=Quercus suber TaxID=58331 RepID=A0AAW0M468_QUESU
MDESGLIQKPKRQKLNEEQDIEKDIKSLDNLPGEIMSTPPRIAGFPVLENLCLDECHWMNQTVVSISVPKLSCLNIHETERKRLTDLDGFQVTILGVSLIGFYYMGEFFNEYSLCNSSLLEEASIYACGFKKRPRKVVANRIYKLLKGFSNAKEIMISSYAVEALKYAAEFPRHMPMFNNLLNLELRQWSINLGSIALLKILQESPNLKTLEFSEGVSLSTACEKVDSIPDPVPPCFLSQLKCIKVGYYNGDEKELSAVKILLKNAVALDSIVISFSKNFAGDLEKRGKVSN